MNRRQFLYSGLAAGSTLITPTSGSPTPRSRDLPTPDSPAENTSPDTVLAEAYGELGLSAGQNHWIWPDDPVFEVLHGDHDRLIVDYEVRTPPETRPPDVLVVDADGREQYEAEVNPPPKVEVVQKSVPILGSIPWPIIYWENLFGSPNENEVIWKEDDPTYSMTVVECLSERAPYSGPLRNSATITPGNYYVIFDWTESVLSSPSTEEVTAEISVRIRRPPDEGVSEQTETAVHDLYSAVERDASGIIHVSKRIAERVCTDVTLPSLNELQEAAPRSTQLVSTLNSILTILGDEIGYQPSVGDRVANATTTWTNWWMATLPIAHSVLRLHEDACAVTTASPANVADRVEDFLLSLGILTADMVMLKTGLVNRSATHLVRAAHRHLLGFLRKTLGLRTYVVLLREFYNLVGSGATNVLKGIKNMTQTIVEETELLDGEDQEKVNQIDADSLYSLDSVDLDLTPNLFNPECDV